MYYRRQLPIMSGVYRSLPTRRFVMMTMGGYWPVIDEDVLKAHTLAMERIAPAQVATP